MDNKKFDSAEAPMLIIYSIVGVIMTALPIVVNKVLTALGFAGSLAGTAQFKAVLIKMLGQKGFDAFFKKGAGIIFGDLFLGLPTMIAAFLLIAGIAFIFLAISGFIAMMNSEIKK